MLTWCWCSGFNQTLDIQLPLASASELHQRQTRKLQDTSTRLLHVCRMASRGKQTLDAATHVSLPAIE